MTKPATALKVVAVCLALALGYWLRDAWRSNAEISLSYRLDLSRLADGAVVVTAQAQAERPIKQFIALVPEKVASHGEVRFSTCSGQDLNASPSTVGAENADFLSFEVEPAERCVRYSYEVGVGLVEYRNNGSHSGYVHGEASDDLLAIHGGHFLIVPAQVPRSSPARIELTNLPSGFMALPPLHEENEGLPSHSSDIGRLAQAAIAAGRLEALDSGVYLQSSIPRESKRAAAQAIEWLRRTLGGTLPGDLTICLTAKSDDGYDIFVPDGPGQIVATLDPLSETRVRGLAERVIALILGRKPSDPRSAWFFQGLSKQVAQAFARSFFAERGRPPFGVEEHLELETAMAYNLSVTEMQEIDTEKYPLTYDRLERRSAEMVRRLDQLRAERGLPEGHLLQMAMRSESAGEAVRQALDWSQSSLEELEHQAKGLDPFTRRPDDPSPLLRLSATPDSPATESLSSALSILFTGGIRGYLENCGCSANQSGGLDKQIAFVTRFRQEFPNAILLDLGNLLAEDTEPSLSEETRRQMKIYSVLAQRLNYDGLAVASSEIYNLDSLLANEFLPLTRYVSVNLAGEGGKLFQRAARIGRTNPPVLLVSAFDSTSAWQPLPGVLEDRLNSYQVNLDLAEISQVIQERGAGALTLLFGHFAPATVQAILEQIPGIDVLIWTSSDIWTQKEEHAYLRRSGFYNGTLVLPGGLLGSYGLQTVRLDISQSGRVLGYKLENVELDSSYEADSEAKEEIGRLYQAHYTDSTADGDRRPAVDRLYAGAERCEPCHRDQFVQWEGTKHAHAYVTLIERRRNFVPECLGCHVVGYKEASFEFDQLQEFGGVQCESCHGPALEHVLSKGKASVRSSMSMEGCVGCHQPERSANFPGRFSEKFEKIRH